MRFKTPKRKKGPSSLVEMLRLVSYNPVSTTHYGLTLNIASFSKKSLPIINIGDVEVLNATKLIN